MLKAYLQIARPDHWFKNIFMLPGLILSISMIENGSQLLSLSNVITGLIAACLIASANYTINEWLDADFDRHHPVKKNRPSVTGKITAQGAYTQWLILAISGLALSYTVNSGFTCLNAIFLLMGMLYNIKPARTKDRQYLDVLSESLNNPLRFMLGWMIVSDTVFPPSSVLIAYWMGGAYLMGIKRYAELRFINDPIIAGKYRRSFLFYTEETLLLSSFFYALISSLFLGVFLIKYRIEFILALPFLALLFTWYLKIGMQSNSVTQTPEKLYTQRKFVGYIILTGTFVIALMLIDIPELEILIIPQSTATP